MAVSALHKRVNFPKLMCACKSRFFILVMLSMPGNRLLVVEGPSLSVITRLGSDSRLG